MNIKIRNYQEVQKFQEGGPVEDPAMAGGAPAPEEVPAEGGAPAGGEDPMQQLLMACEQVLQTQDCNLAMQVCQALMQMAGGGGEPAPAAPEGAEPVYRRGGRLSYWAKK